MTSKDINIIELGKNMMKESGYMVFHLVAASIFTIYMKEQNPLILTGLLMVILSYISYVSQNERPLYVLLLFGLGIYIIDIFIISKKDKTIIFEQNGNLKKDRFIDIIKKTIWKVPFFGILSHYIMLSGAYFSIKK